MELAGVGLEPPPMPRGPAWGAESCQSAKGGLGGVPPTVPGELPQLILRTQTPPGLGMSLVWESPLLSLTLSFPV